MIEEESRILNWFIKEHNDECLQLLQMCHKFTYHYHKGLLEPPFYLIKKVYMLDRIMIDSGKSRAMCGNIIKHIFSTHSANVSDSTKYAFNNMVDSLTHILEMGNCLNDDNDNDINDNDDCDDNDAMVDVIMIVVMMMGWIMVMMMTIMLLLNIH